MWPAGALGRAAPLRAPVAPPEPVANTCAWWCTPTRLPSQPHLTNTDRAHNPSSAPRPRAPRSKEMGREMTEDNAISLMTTGLDFAVTQVVDQNWGIHTVIPKWVFEGTTDGSKKETYTPKT